MREIIMTGKTVEEATELACSELGLPREEVSIEILEMPQKKFFKTIPAKVKATADLEEDVSADKESKVIEATLVDKEKTVEIKPKETANQPKEKMISIGDASTDEKIAAAATYLKDICAKMNIGEVQINAEMRGEALIFKIEGSEVGALIGRRGETMEAVSYLCSLVANRMGGDYLKIGLDVGGYREKREGDLEALARKVCDKVNKTNRAQMLEPMNPYERRIIHSAVSEMQGVRSESTGEGVSRRVVVLSTAEGAKNERPDRYDKSTSPRQNSKGGYKGNGKPRFNNGGRSGESRDNRGPRRPSNTPQRDFANKPHTGEAPKAPQRTASINDGADMPLYGKINF